VLGGRLLRNAQFEHINTKVKAFQAAGEPAISVDTKKPVPGLSCPFSRAPAAVSLPGVCAPAVARDVGVHGGGRALSDG